MSSGSSGKDCPTVTALIAPGWAPVPSAQWRLSVVEGEDVGTSLKLDDTTHDVGKSTECALTLTDQSVSRRHLQIFPVDGGIGVRDLDSKNGTFLAGVRVAECVVGAGAILRIGNTLLRVTRDLPGGGSGPRISERSEFGALYGHSVAMRELFAVLESSAPSELPILIEGETGTGKELCAQAIHAHSSRAQQQLVVCDLAAVNSNLIESDLFGHVRGAFTGAHTQRHGAFVDADGGTLFIDELGELDIALQSRLLRAIENRQVKPVGGSKYRQVDVRVVAATNRDLKTEVKEGRFRADLYHRLSVVCVKLPSLRRRKEDIPELAARIASEHGLELLPETVAVLSEYDWPGNVRELRNVIDRGAAQVSQGMTTLPPALLGLDTVGASESISWPQLGQSGFIDARDRLIATWEHSYLEKLLARTGGNVSQAARESGIERAYLHRLMKRHGIKRPSGAKPHSSA